MKRIYQWFARGEGRDGQYRQTTNRLGAALLFFLALYIGFDLMAFPWAKREISALAQEPWRSVLIELCDSALYLLSFMLPVVLFVKITPPSQRMLPALAPRLPRKLHLLLPAGLAVIYCASAFNAFWMKHLGLSGATPHIGWATDLPIYQGILWFLASALVPAFCEEFLFRGWIVPQLLPYGKGVAVIGSAVLFGLMHQNPGQLFYATVAGVLLALLVIESGSIWAGVLLHMLNNLISVAQTILYEQFSARAADQIFAIVEVVVIGGGMLCLIAYVMGQDDREDSRPKQHKVTGEGNNIRPVRSFFSPLMSAFVGLCVLQMAFLVYLMLR